MDHCFLGDGGSAIFDWFELVTKEKGRNPRDAFDSQITTGFILNYLKSNI